MSVGNKASEGDSQSRKDGSNWGRAIRIVLLSLAGLVVLFFLLVTGIIPMVLSYLWPTVYYTEVFADVTAEGQRYQLSSIAKCTLRAKARFGGLVAGDTPTVITGGLMAKRLPSGAGLIIVGPALCSEPRLSELPRITVKEDISDPYDIRTVDLQNYLEFQGPTDSPKVLRLDDAEDPSLIAAYWREYATRRDTDLRIHNIRYRRLRHAPSTGPENPDREVPWLEGRRPPDKVVCKPSPATWVGYFTYVVDEEVWYEKEELEYLRRINRIETIKWPETINIYRYPLQNIIVNITADQLVIEKYNKLNIGYYEFHKIDSLKHGTSFADFTLVVIGKKLRPPNVAFFDPYSKVIRVIGDDLYSKDAICR